MLVLRKFAKSKYKPVYNDKNYTRNKFMPLYDGIQLFVYIYMGEKCLVPLLTDNFTVYTGTTLIGHME